MLVLLVLNLVLVIGNFAQENPILAGDQDAFLTAPQLIVKYGYPCEIHYVTTSDGYILAIHRIPHGRNSTSPSKQVVFLQHGLFNSSADWLLLGTLKALAYLLADAGYDVWLGNERGNTYSRNHTTLDPNHSAAFWDFSWHEIGTIDMPTMIDYALNNTGQKELFHVGFSQGTTTFYVMASMRPEYNAKIRAHFSLAPIAYMGHLFSPLMHIISLWEGPLDGLLKLIGVYEFAPSSEFLALGGDLICADGDVTQILCEDSVFSICGFSPKEMNGSLLPIISGHTPAGASTKQVLHYAQEINSGYFRQYDYGVLGNFKRYGSVFPPSYDVSKITAPVYIFYSYNDWMSSVVDMERLYQELSNCKGIFPVALHSFNHLDYMYGINANELVYKNVINLLQTHH